jgi:glucosyl-dolichyl phosphate glucuronosyltransferase
MDVTVILCTFNRCSLLPDALESIAVSSMPEGTDWEVLVVDNNSSDHTHEVVDSFIARYPGRFRYLFEPNPGKSYALNAGISSAQGKVLAFVDDDVTVAEEWLEKLTSPVQTNDWAGAGGRVLPEWTQAVPEWLAKESWAIAGPLVYFDRGSESSVLNETPVGTNMAFQKRVFERYGGFRVDLGPSPHNEIRNEDSEFVRRLFAGGERLYYEPRAIVYHPVTEERLTKKYFLTWWFDKGRSQIRESGVPTDGTRTIRGVPLQFVRRWIKWVFYWLMTTRERERFEAKLKAWFNAGLISECYRQSRLDSIPSEVRINSRTVL